MSFANKGRDSKDTVKLRSEYEAHAIRVRDGKFNNATEKDAAMADKAKAFGKLRANIIGERRENLAAVHKVLIQQGKLKTREQHAAEVAAARARAGEVK